jgi:pimeloyl-ACP methyl ester carboxylesterase
MSEQLSQVPHDLPVNGISLHYATWGEFTTPERAVLLVPGLTANSQEFGLLGPALAAQGWYAIAPDLRGRGLSDKPPHGYGIPYHVNDLLALCDALSLPAPQIIGQSLGAMIGCFYAAIHPQRLGRLVLIDAGGTVPADALQAIAASLSRLGQVYPSLDAYLETRRQTPIHTWNPLWEAYYRYDAEVHADGTVTSRVSKAAIDEEIMVNATINADILLPRVQAPTLILRATLGTLAPDRGFILPADEAERVQSIISGSRLVAVPDTNHYTIIASDVFIRETLAFLAE